MTPSVAEPTAPKMASPAKPEVSRWEDEGGRPAIQIPEDPRRALPGFGRGTRNAIRREEEDERDRIDAAEGRLGWVDPEKTGREARQRPDPSSGGEGSAS